MADTRGKGPERAGSTRGSEHEAVRSSNDRDQAAVKYETIRRKLIRLFEWRGCELPEDLTDVTLDRVAKRIAEGVEVRSADPFGYICGFAHLVYKEEWRRAAREHKILNSGDWPPPSLPEEEPDARTTIQAVQREGRRALSIPGDVKNPAFCREAVRRCVEELGRLDVLVNNAAYQKHRKGIDDLDALTVPDEESWREERREFLLY